MKTLVGTYENLQIERNSITTILQKVFHTHKLFFVNILPLPTHLWAWNYESILKILLLESIKKNFTQTVKHRSMQENPLPPSRRSSPPTNTLLAFPPMLKYFQHTWQEFPFSYIILFTNGKWQFLPLFIQNSCFYETHPNLLAHYTLIPPSHHPYRNLYRQLCHEKLSL